MQHSNISRRPLLDKNIIVNQIMIIVCHMYFSDISSHKSCRFYCFKICMYFKSDHCIVHIISNKVGFIQENSNVLGQLLYLDQLRLLHMLVRILIRAPDKMGFGEQFRDKFSYVSVKTICCNQSLEPSRLDSSKGRLQHTLFMVIGEILKIIPKLLLLPTPSYLEHSLYLSRECEE